MIISRDFFNGRFIHCHVTSLNLIFVNVSYVHSENGIEISFFTILPFTSAGVEVAPPVVTTVEATAGVVTDETVCVGAGCVVADCDTTTGAVAMSGPGKAFAETTCGVPDDPVWRLSLSCPSSIKF